MADFFVDMWLSVKLNIKLKIRLNSKQHAEVNKLSKNIKILAVHAVW